MVVEGEGPPRRPVRRRSARPAAGRHQIAGDQFPPVEGVSGRHDPRRRRGRTDSRRTWTDTRRLAAGGGMIL
jgi:hypothetical protein